MMGRFMAESESLFSSRSVSPTQDTNIDDAYTNRNDSHTLEPPIKRERLELEDDFYDSQKENVYNSSAPTVSSYHTNNLSYETNRGAEDGWRTSTTISLTN